LGEEFGSAFEGMGDWFEKNETKIARTIGDLIGSAIAKGIELTVEFIALPLLLANMLYNAVTGVEGNDEAMSRISDIGRWFIDGIVEGFKRTVENSEALTALIDGLNSLVASLAQSLGIETGANGEQVARKTIPLGNALVSGLIAGILGFNDKVKTAVNQLVLDAVVQAVEWDLQLKTAAHDTIKGFIKGLEEKKDDVIHWVERMVGDMIAAVKRLLGIDKSSGDESSGGGGGSSTYRAFGRSVVAGYARGIIDATPEAVQAMTDAMQKVMGAVSSITLSLIHI